MSSISIFIEGSQNLTLAPRAPFAIRVPMPTPVTWPLGNSTVPFREDVIERANNALVFS